MSLDAFIKEGKILRMCLACRNKKNTWYANSIHKGGNKKYVLFQKSKLSQINSSQSQKKNQSPILQPEDVVLKFASNNDDDGNISFDDFYLEYLNLNPQIVEVGESPHSISILNLIE
jgi:hypothetical protein